KGKCKKGDEDITQCSHSTILHDKLKNFPTPEIQKASEPYLLRGFLTSFI
ncbi:MAG: hypothetical protein ACI9EW_002283, partial [Cellvibrionaceae bacterium]